MGAVGGAAVRLEAGALHARARLLRRTTTCGAGRWRTSTASGARSGSCTRSGREPERGARRRRRCRARSGSRAPSSTTPSTCSAAAAGGRAALVHATELRELAELTWDELRDQVARCAAGLRRLGVGGATAWSPTCRTWPRPSSRSWRPLASVRSGRAARRSSARRRVVDRFAQIEPKVLIATEGYRYGGRDFDRRERVREIERGRDADARADDHGAVATGTTCSPTRRR